MPCLSRPPLGNQIDDFLVMVFERKGRDEGKHSIKAMRIHHCNVIHDRQVKGLLCAASKKTIKRNKTSPTFPYSKVGLRGEVEKEQAS